MEIFTNYKNNGIINNHQFFSSNIIKKYNILKLIFNDHDISYKIIKFFSNFHYYNEPKYKLIDDKIINKYNILQTIFDNHDISFLILTKTLQIEESEIKDVIKFMLEPLLDVVFDYLNDLRDGINTSYANHFDYMENLHVINASYNFSNFGYQHSYIDSFLSNIYNFKSEIRYTIRKRCSVENFIEEYKDLQEILYDFYQITVYDQDNTLYYEWNI